MSFNGHFSRVSWAVDGILIITADNHQQAVKGNERGHSFCQWLVNMIMDCDELHWLNVHERTKYKLGTSLITSSQPLMLLLTVFIYDPLNWIVSLFLAADLARTAVGIFITLARQSGTRCQMNWEILTVLMALNDFWKQFSSAVTTVTSALDVL